jgi:iron complex transport system ATP-binding protein
MTEAQRSVSPALESRGLTVSIGGKSICSDLSLGFNAGECWAILGLNGAGKTTLIHTLAGVRPAQGGSVWLDGAALTEQPRIEVARKLGLLAQDTFDAFDTTVLETALIGRHPHLARWGWWQWEGDDDERIANEAIAGVGLDGFAQRSVSTLSGGERERLAIAAVLTQQPKVFLLDEPTSHLDTHRQLAVLELFARKAKAETCTVLMSLHDASLAARYCTHALLLFDDGETAAGPVSEILAAETLSRLYRHTMREINSEGLRLFVPV